MKNSCFGRQERRVRVVFDDFLAIFGVFGGMVSLRQGLSDKLLEQPNTALPDSHSETDEMFHAKRAGKKANGTPIPMIHREKEPISNAGTGHMIMTALPSLEWWEEKAGRCAYM